MRKDIRERIDRIKRGEVPEGYKKTRLGIIPESWEVKRVKESVRIRNNLRTPISKEVRETIKGEYPYYGPTQIQDYINSYTIEGASVLIGEDGDHFLKYRDKEMTMYVDGKYSVNNHAHVIQERGDCDIKWFMYIFQHRNLFNSITRQGAGRYKLTKDSLEKIYMCVPDRKEQERIIEILEKYDLIIDLMKKKSKYVIKAKKWLMQNLLTGKRRLAGFHSLWEKVLIKDIVLEGSKEKVDDIKAYKKIKIKLNFGGIEFLNTCRKMADTRPFYVRKKGEIIVGKQNYFHGSIAIVDEEFDGTICSNAIMSFLVKENCCDKYFLLYYLSQTDYINKKSFFANGTGQKELSENDFLNFDIRLPELEEQKAIAQVLATADREIELLKKQLEQIKREKKAMMQLLLTGIVRVDEK